jgi:hypothetical protein
MLLDVINTCDMKYVCSCPASAVRLQVSLTLDMTWDIGLEFQDEMWGSSGRKTFQWALSDSRLREILNYYIDFECGYECLCRRASLT